MFWLFGEIEQMLAVISPSKLMLPVSAAAAKAPCDTAATAAITANLERCFFDMKVLNIDMKNCPQPIADNCHRIDRKPRRTSHHTIEIKNVINSFNHSKTTAIDFYKYISIKSVWLIF
ncbi:hypothetical protein [Variovorax sp. PDC80]|uniref:hypothetical protein n=1 Tax=Variovorax sp. PDC80 TaxID=1882827 RepID=UPI00210EDD3F|nr:hypothetical protein [Variovorax sp. PDC80]